MKLISGVWHLRHWYQLIAVVATLSAGDLHRWKPPTSVNGQKPNIIIILADDVGWNDVGWHNRDIATPNLNALVDSGVELRSSYVTSLCSPSRAALLTGIYPFKLGLQHGVLKATKPHGLPLNVTLLPERLRRLGYATHMIGKWHLGFCNWAYTPTYRGFDSFFGFYTGQQDYFRHTTGGGYDFRYNKKVFRAKAKRYSTTTFGKHAADVIFNHKSPSPLFIYLALQAAHAPLQVPQKFEDLHRNITNQRRRKFAGMVAAADEAVGEIMTALRKSNMHKNTLIVFLSDNGATPLGAGNNWPLRGGKSTLWEGGTRVPSFIWGKMLKVRTPMIHRGMIHVVDWYPTIIAAAGGKPDAESDIDGMVQWDMLRLGLPSNRTQFVYNINRITGSAALRMGKFKLIEGNPGFNSDWIPPASEKDDDLKLLKQNFRFHRRSFDQTLLYNVEDDEIESNDLSHTYPDVVARMRQILEAYRRQEVEPFNPQKVRKALPKFWDGTWSPGWCH